MTANDIERIVVMFHRPLWGVNPDRVKSEYEVLRPIWHDYLVENGVDLVFNGYDHHFYHTVRNGTHYTVTGGGTAKLYVPVPDHPEVQKTWLEGDFTFMDNHVCQVEVTETGFDIDVIVTNGTTVYEYNATASTDLYPPVVNSPEDIMIVEGTSGNTVNWTAIDAHLGQFSILQNGTVVKEDSWINGTQIVHVLDGLQEGIYNFTIILTDKIGHITNDTVIVRVDPAPAETTTVTSETTTGSTETTTGFNGLEILILLPVLFIYRKKR